MTPEEINALEAAVETSRNDPDDVVRRRAWLLLRWWASIGFRRESFFRVFGFLGGLCARNLGGWPLAIVVKLARKAGNLAVGVESHNWLDSMMVAWFVSKHPAFVSILFSAAIQKPGAVPLPDDRARLLRSQRAQLILASARCRHQDLDSELRMMESTHGPCTPPIEAGAFSGLV